MIESYAEELEKHLRGEEDHVAGMPRKYIPLELHKQIVRKVGEIVDEQNEIRGVLWYVR